MARTLLSAQCIVEQSPTSTPIWLMQLYHSALMNVMCAEAGFQFTAQTADWGLTNFATQEQVYSPSEGFLVNDTLRFKVSIRNYSYNDRAGAHRYTVVQLARETDFAAQIGYSQYFDLVDLDKVCLACLNSHALLLFKFAPVASALSEATYKDAHHYNAQSELSTSTKHNRMQGARLKGAQVRWMLHHTPNTSSRQRSIPSAQAHVTRHFWCMTLQ